jgi:hypothetical protein
MRKMMHVERRWKKRRKEKRSAPLHHGFMQLPQPALAQTWPRGVCQTSKTPKNLSAHESEERERGRVGRYKGILRFVYYESIKLDL